MKRQSLANYAHEHCANWLSTYCDQVWTENAAKAENPNKIIQNTDLVSGRCRLAERKPCVYFRQNVLPAWACPADIRSAYQEMDRSYQGGGRERLCPDCGTESLKRRQRVCTNCRRKHRLQTYRQARKKIGPTRHS